jgi:hypothetical protein
MVVGCAADRPVEPAPPPAVVPPRIEGWETIPRVLDPNADVPVVARVVVSGDASSVQFARRGVPEFRRQTMELTPARVVLAGTEGKVFELATTSGTLLRDFQSVEGGNFGGRVYAVPKTGADTVSLAVNLTVASRVGAAVPTRLSESVQVSSHVINIAVSLDADAVRQSSSWQSAVVVDALKASGVEPDFAFLLPPLYAPYSGRAYYRSIRNAITGTGMPVFDHTNLPDFAVLKNLTPAERHHHDRRSRPR